MMRKLRRQKRLAGVTLVEVMVVAGALSSLGGNAFQGAMDKSRQTQCENNLRQLGMALQMFVDDNDGKFPAAWFLPKDAEKDPGSIEKILMPYVKNKPLFVCPSAPEAFQKFGLCYVWNDQLNNMLRDQVPDLAKVWVMTDVNVVATVITADQAKQAKINLSVIPPAHTGGYNVLYADGHVKWSKEPPVIKPVVQQARPQQRQSQGGGGDDD